jgi:Protein NO VEIN, C-terminal
MKLKEIVEALYEDSKKTPLRGLSAIAEAEKYLRQAYEGRYFFELIQNVRDANKEINKDGNLFIVVTDDYLSVSNTGAPFSKKGIESITTIGESTKESQDFIGFKGIGFKSVQEITNTPQILTRYGVVLFDRSLTLKNYKRHKLQERQIPLFYFPHFKETKLSVEEISLEIVTKVKLPFKENISAGRIIDDFNKIQAEQLVLLGNIKNLEFKSESKLTTFSIKKDQSKHYIEVRKNEDEIHRFRNYSPSEKFTVPKEIIESLEGKEKDIFSNTPQIDVNIVLELNNKGQINSIDNAKLYLFYPLEFNSGFRFIIHSYFIVNPERTALRNSPLNSFLQKAIGEFIGNEMLKILKSSKTNTTKILTFQRNKDAKLNELYDSVVENLKKQKFIYDSQTRRYFSASEVIVADGFDKGLFPDKKLGDKHLIYADDTVTRDWLRTEFSIPYLSYDQIAQEIENECLIQAKKRNIKFFQNLYNYVSEHTSLNLTGRKVLLTDRWKLVSSEDNVFYGGGRRSSINLSDKIKRHIHFIHNDIKIPDFREGKSRTGITEFNTFELVKRLLKLFNTNKVPKTDLLNALFNLEIDLKSELEIKENVLLPIKGKNKWVSPINNPIYFETEHLKDLYPNGNFVNENILITQSLNELKDKKSFLKMAGVWDIPAVYLSEKYSLIYRSDSREKILSNLSNLATRPFYLSNDRILDKPRKINRWFTQSILENYGHYKAFIQQDFLPKMQFSTMSSGSKNPPKEVFFALSDFSEALKKEKWIVFSGEEDAYSVKDIIGIHPTEFHQSHNQVIKKYLKLLPINYSLNRDFLKFTGLVHLDGDSIENFISILNFVYTKYKNVNPLEKDFIDFFNRILSKLFDFYYFKTSQTQRILELKEIFFLAIDEITKGESWKKARDIFYIDDKPNYDLLPIEIKQRVQPHFTNRDKNTFGKIAAKIGKKFSDSIQKKLVETETLNEYLLATYFEYLAEAVAILEASLDIVLNKELDVLKTVKVYEKQNVIVSIKVGDSDSKKITVDHFVDVDSNYDLYLSKSYFHSKNKLIAEAVSELFVKILDRDLRKFNLTLFDFLDRNDKVDYLKLHEISEERIRELNDKLIVSESTPLQKFWDAILLAKRIYDREDIFVNKGINVNKLAEQLEITPASIQHFLETFDFSDTNNVLNINPISKLLESLTVSLSEVNEFLFPRIDFRDYYIKQVQRIRDRFQKGFESFLYDYLKSKTWKEKESYQNKIDAYKYNLKFFVPLNSTSINIEELFINQLNKDFSPIKFSVNDLNKGFDKFNPNEIYKTQLNQFIEKIASIQYTTEELDTFLAENKRRSLLYFDETKILSETFRQWLQENKKRNKSKQQDSLLDVLTEISNSNETEIEVVSVSSVNLPTNEHPGGTWDGGRRIDGSAGDNKKHNIGLVAEMIVFKELKDSYKDVLWVSKNASKIYKSHEGYNPEGDDSLGYDIEYLDEEGNKFFVEVKGKSDSADSFEVSRKEIEKAQNAKEFYKVIFVTNTMDKSKRRIRDLGNIFLLDKGEDFLRNRKFKAIYKSFEIRFLSSEITI